MKITVTPQHLETLLAPYVGFSWRVDAVAYGGCLACIAETKNLRIARRCPAESGKTTDSQRTSLLVNPLFEIAQLGVKEGIWPIVINERIVTLGHANYELEFSRVDMQRPMLLGDTASNWFAPWGKSIASVDSQKLAGMARIGKGKQAVLTLGDKAFLFDDEESAAVALALDGKAEAWHHRGRTTIFGADCAAELLTPLTVFDASPAQALTTTSEAAGKLGVDPDRLLAACDNRHVPSYSVAGETMVDVSEIRALRSTEAKLGGLPELPGLSPRASHVLFFARVDSAEKLASTSDLDLSLTPNCGKKTLHEILSAADQAGIPIRRDPRLPKALR